jgi:hypothetical protein
MQTLFIVIELVPIGCNHKFFLFDNFVSNESLLLRNLTRKTVKVLTIGQLRLFRNKVLQDNSVSVVKAQNYLKKRNRI